MTPMMLKYGRCLSGPRFRASHRARILGLGLSASIAIAAPLSAESLTPPELRECPMHIEHSTMHVLEWCLRKPAEHLTGAFATCKDMVDYANAWHAHCDPKHRPFIETWDEFAKRRAAEEGH
jgi:hypothetical protein